MAQPPTEELFVPYVPGWLRTQLSATSLLPGSAWHLDATILYADLQNFSALTAALARLPDGAEKLHAVLSRFYTTMVTTVAAYAGEVVSIAGDALTVWWPNHSDLGQGQHCGTAMLAALAPMPTIDTPDGPFRLGLRIGVAAGPISAVLVGLPAYGVHLTLYGPALEAATTAQRSALPGEVRVGLNTRRSGSHSPEETLDTTVWTELSPHARFPNDSTQNVRLTLNHFLPPSFAERLHIGVMLAEYRRCAPVFAAFHLPATAAALHSLVAHVQTIVSRWGGWLNEVEIGDKGAVLVLLFGAPTAHGDDALRAVGCCLELHTSGMITHAGVTVGTLFVGAVGSPLRRVYTVQGTEMNLAAHLMQAAHPGSILISGRVRQEVAGRYPVSEPALLTVKGHAVPLPIVRVIPAVKRHRQSGGSSPHRYLPDSTSIIGRTAERAVLKRAVEIASAGRTQIVLVQGESGIGKSDLLQEVMSLWLERGLQGYSSECSSNGQEMLCRPWRPILADICGIDETAPLAIQYNHLIGILATLRSHQYGILDPERQAERYDGPHQTDIDIQLLAYLLGLDDSETITILRDEDDTTLPVSMHIAQMQERMLDLASALLQRRLAQAPLLVMLEDIHWADQLSLRLTARLASPGHDVSDDSYPLLLTLSHRPFDQPLPTPLSALYEHPGCSQLTLGALTPEQGQELLCTLLDAQAVTPRLGQLVEYHAQGQPLFIKEYVRALNEHRLVAINDGLAQLLSDPHDVQLSETVQGIIQARIDRLDETTRLTLKAAAAIGHMFQLKLLHAIHPARPPRPLLLAQLDQLIRLNILKLELDEPERVYRFKHNSIHAVVYTNLLFHQRRTLHATVARWYEATYAEDLRRGGATTAVYGLLAYHYGRADNSVAQAHYCQAAGEQAARQYAHVTALEYLATALALTRIPAQRYNLLLTRVAVYDRIDERTAQANDIAALAALADQMDDDMHRALARCLDLHYTLALGHYYSTLTLALNTRHIVLRSAHQAQSALKHRRTMLLWAICLDAQGQAHMGLGHLATAQALHERALIIYRWALNSRLGGTETQKYIRSGQRRYGGAHLPDGVFQYPDSAIDMVLDPHTLFLRCLNHLGATFAAQGNSTQARHCHQQALDVARLAGNGSDEAHTLVLFSQTHCVQGDYETACQYAERALGISRGTGERTTQASALRHLARAKAAAGNYREAQRYGMQALAISSGIGTRLLDIFILRDLADIALALGDITSAHNLGAEAEALRQAVLREDLEEAVANSR